MTEGTAAEAHFRVIAFAAAFSIAAAGLLVALLLGAMLAALHNVLWVLPNRGAIRAREVCAIGPSEDDELVLRPAHSAWGWGMLVATLGV